MEGLLKAISFISPPPVTPQTGAYDGYELRWKVFTFRPRQFVFEAFLIGILGTYVLIYFVGKYINEGRARKT